MTHSTATRSDSQYSLARILGIRALAAVGNGLGLWRLWAMMVDAGAGPQTPGPGRLRGRARAKAMPAGLPTSRALCRGVARTAALPSPAARRLT